MKVLKLVALAAAFSASTFAMADETVVHQGNVFEANQLIPTGARLEVGTTGYGGALLWTANPYVGLALGYNGGDISWSDDLSIDGTKYDMDMDNNLTYLNAEIRPWGASQNVWAQGLYVAAGVGYVDSKYDLKKSLNNTNDTLKIDGKNYYAPTGQGSIDGTVDYDNQIAPYLGFGFAPKINKNWGVFGEVGAYYTGNPNANLNATGLQEVGGTASGDYAAERLEYKVSNDDKYQWLPVGKVGVSYHW
ncbi:ornithine uptake porin CarO [Acinetobacter rongchengensis]|uniref:Carbapenem-associated resistance protein n=1 Tax=Acinetobacter rongchengensis TaxID=2419601 RepID=A0A3A8EYR5_9GAMM|nr:ornithine uptake porin CarO [Acinetobacter rongchengensis]RKG39249.1 hypothetical protein D7V20_05230 [Acinetobacter rongchengensis]